MVSSNRLTLEYDHKILFLEVLLVVGVTLCGAARDDRVLLGGSQPLGGARVIGQDEEQERHEADRGDALSVSAYCVDGSEDIPQG